MNIAEIVAIVASLLTIASFIFSIYQHIKLRSAEQALRIIEANARAGLLESTELERKASSIENLHSHPIGAQRDP